MRLLNERRGQKETPTDNRINERSGTNGTESGRAPGVAVHRVWSHGFASLTRDQRSLRA